MESPPPRPTPPFAFGLPRLPVQPSSTPPLLQPSPPPRPPAPPPQFVFHGADRCPPGPLPLSARPLLPTPYLLPFELGMSERLDSAKEHAEQLVREKKVGYVDEALLRASEAREMKLEEDLNLKVAQLAEEKRKQEAEKKRAHEEAEDELFKTHDQLLHAKEELEQEKTERVKEREAAAGLLKRTIDEWTVKLEHERAERAKEKELLNFMVSRQKALTCAPVDGAGGASAHESETESEGWVEAPSAFDDEPDVEIVRLHGLCARPELNGVYGIITGAKRADGRYPVKLYPEDRSVLVLACNLTMVGGYDDDYSYSHDEDSESDHSGDDHPSKSPRHATDPTPPKPPPKPPPAPVAATAPSTAVHPSIGSAHARYMTRRASLLGLLPRKWLGADGRTTWRFSVTPECSCHWRAHMRPTSSAADTASNLQTEAAEPEQQQLIAIPPLRSIKAPDTLPAKSPSKAIPTSTPPRTVVHPRHTQLADVTDISRRLFSQSPTPSSPLLPPSITDTSADLQLEVATALQHAAARPTSTPGTPRRHAKEALRKAASIQAQHKHQCRLADAERARVAEEARRKAMVQKAHQLGTEQPLWLPGSARDRTQVQEAKHARRRAKEDRRKASHARGAAAVTPVLAAAAALAAAEAVPRQRMPGESGPAYRRPSRGEEPDWPGQPEGARASAREPLGTLWW